ncbi:MAG: hypothetical protein JW822_05455 [Spirochaetales bacterium]|nr:hypothetical protein [Spirochaetales bacterium]
MIEPLEIIAELLIKHYAPIGNIEHKYKTKVTAIGLLKSADMISPMFYAPYYDRLMSYKLLVKNLMDNFKLSREISKKILADIVWKVANDETVPEKERYKSPLLILLILLLNPEFEKQGKEQIFTVSKKFLANLNSAEECLIVAEFIISHFLDLENSFDELAQKIVKKCLTGVKQEHVMERLEGAIYNFFVYAYYDQPKRQLRYEMAFQYKNSKERIEPFFNPKIVARSIISRVGRYKTNVNFFGPRISNFDEIKEFFKKHQNITVMFF